MKVQTVMDIWYSFVIGLPVQILISNWVRCVALDIHVISEQSLQMDHGTIFYTLFGHISSGVIWQGARDHCHAIGQDLAIINSEYAQNVLVNLTDPIGNEDTANVWLAGRRAFGEDYWAYFEDATLNRSVNNNFDSNCAKLYLDKHGLMELRDTPCTDSTNLQALCQYPANISGCLDGFLYNNVCYTTSSWFLNWFEGMTYCMRLYDGVLAHNALFEDEIKAWLLARLGDTRGRYALELSVGVRRRPWTWVANTSQSEATYYNWLEGYGDYRGSADRCILMSGDNGGRWIDVPCSETWNYFICAKDETLTTISDITEIGTTEYNMYVTISSRTDERPASDTTTAESSDSSTSEILETTVALTAATVADSSTCSFKSGYLAAIIVVISVLCLLVVALLCRRYRDQQHRGLADRHVSREGVINTDHLEPTDPSSDQREDGVGKTANCESNTAVGADSNIVRKEHGGTTLVKKSGESCHDVSDVNCGRPLASIELDGFDEIVVDNVIYVPL